MAVVDAGVSAARHTALTGTNEHSALVALLKWAGREFQPSQVVAELLRNSYPKGWVVFDLKALRPSVITPIRILGLYIIIYFQLKRVGGVGS